MNVPDTQESLRQLLANTTTDGDCSRWLGRHNHKGYGYVFAEGREHSVHRYVHELAIGPIPAGFDVDHVAARGCRFRDCIEPDHLEAVTHAENVRRSNGPAGVNARKLKCLRGHPLSGSNLAPRANGHRECLECRKTLDRARVMCGDCGITILRKNLAAHRTRKHKPRADRIAREAGIATEGNKTGENSE